MSFLKSVLDGYFVYVIFTKPPYLHSPKFIWKYSNITQILFSFAAYKA